MGRLMDVYKTIKNCLPVEELTRQDTANSSIIMPTRKNTKNRLQNGREKTEKEPMP